MSRLLPGVRFRPHRLTLLGALGGMLAAAGRDLPQAYLVGVTGHGFRLTLDAVISPGAPHELNFHEVFPLWEGLGAWFKRIAARPADANFEAVRTDVLARCRESVDRGVPAISFDLAGLPEYGLVVGYEGAKLACLTLESPQEPVWMESDHWPPQAHRSFTRAEVITLLDVAPTFDRRRAELASLRFAVEQFWAPGSRDLWLQQGRRAYEFWAGVLASSLPLHGGVDPGLGHSYNLMVLHRVRQDVAAYLTELAIHHAEASPLAAAAEAFAQVSALLDEAVHLLPFPGSGALQSQEQRQALARLLRQVMVIEERGVADIERALRALR